MCVKGLDNAARVMIDPWHKNYVHRRCCVVMTVIFFTCITGGLALIASAIWRCGRDKCRGIKTENETHQKIKNLFKKTVVSPASDVSTFDASKKKESGTKLAESAKPGKPDQYTGALLFEAPKAVVKKPVKHPQPEKLVEEDTKELAEHFQSEKAAEAENLQPEKLVEEDAKELGEKADHQDSAELAKNFQPEKSAEAENPQPEKLAEKDAKELGEKADHQNSALKVGNGEAVDGALPVDKAPRIKPGQQFASRDLQTFRFALKTIREEAEKANKGGEKQKTSKEARMDVRGASYVIWFTDQTRNGQPIIFNGVQCGVINIQDHQNWCLGKLSNKLGLLINEAGDVLSVHRDGQPSNDGIKLTPEEVEKVEACFETALKISSRYSIVFKPTLAPDIEIMVVRRGLARVPGYHMKMMSSSITRRVGGDHPKSCPKIFVTFLKANMQKKIGHDDGGLSKDYISDLVANFITSNRNPNDKRPLFTTVGTEASLSILPTLEMSEKEKEDKIGQEKRNELSQLGVLLMFSYLSSLEKRPCPIGTYFSPKMFDIILSLEAVEVNGAFEGISKAKRFKMLKTLLELLTSEGEMPLKTQQEITGVMALCLQGNLVEKEIVEAIEWLYAIDSDYVPQMFKNKEDELDTALVKENLQEALQVLENGIFSLYGTGNKLRGIHAVARGMKSVCRPEDVTQNSIVWNAHHFTSRGNDFSEAIQGTVQRDKITAAIHEEELKEGAEEITKKVGWLKKWLTHEATDEEVRSFLRYTIGAASFPSNGKITVIAQKGSPIPIPQAHTCFNRLDIAPVPCKMMGLDDSTEKGFIHALKIAMEKGTTYSTG